MRYVLVLWLVVTTAFGAVVALPAQTRMTDAERVTARQALAPTGLLRVAFLRDNPIHGRVNPQTGAVTGLVADVVRELGMTLDLPTRLLASENPAAVIRNLTMGAADVGVLAYDAEREAQIDYAGNLAVMRSSYVVSGLSAIRLSSDVDRTGIVVGAVKGQTQQIVLADTLRAARLRVFETQPSREEIERVLVANEVQAFAMNRQRALDLVAQAPRLRALPDSFVDVPQAFVVGKGETAKKGVLLRVAADLRASGFVSASIQKARLEDSAAAATR